MALDDLHCHPCEVCGVPVDCEDACDGDQQTIVYCSEHDELTAPRRETKAE